MVHFPVFAFCCQILLRAAPGSACLRLIKDLPENQLHFPILELKETPKLLCEEDLWPGEMVAEVQRQFSKVDSKGKTLLTGSTELKPDSKTCIQISTQVPPAVS